MSRYAQNTNVDSTRSKSEIEKTVIRYGATGFVSGWQGQEATIMFDLGNRRVRFRLRLPNQSEFTRTETGRSRAQEASLKAWEQACRQSWRALALVVKAKLEAVESGITTFEEEFLAHLVLPGSGGATVGERLLADGGAALDSGKLPRLLPGK